MHQSDVLSHRHAVLMGVNSCSETYNCENFLKSMVFLSRLHWNTGIISFDLFRSSSDTGPRRLCSPPALLPGSFRGHIRLPGQPLTQSFCCGPSPRVAVKS
jgi:hypothetical protein